MPLPRSVLAEARRVLTEAEADQSLMLAADEWRQFVRMGDQMLDAVQSVADAAAAAAQAEDRMAARRANADVGAGVRLVTNVTGKAYGHFASGRTALYDYAKTMGVPTKRSSGPIKHIAVLTTQTDGELLKAVEASSAKLGPSVASMLDLGARAQRNFRDAAIASVQAGENLPSDLAKQVVDIGLDFRDSVGSNLFARVNGIMRRSAELSKRAWEMMMMEDSAGWTAPWERDPEFGDTELV